MNIFKIPRDQFILIIACLITLNYAVNLGVNWYFGYYAPEYICSLHELGLLFALIYYVQAIGYKFPYSFDRAFFIYVFNIFYVPYILVHQKKWFWGVVYTAFWLFLFFTSYWFTSIVDLVFGDTYYEWDE